MDCPGSILGIKNRFSCGFYAQGKTTSPWLILIPSKRRADMLFHRRNGKTSRRFYSRKDEFGLGLLIAEFLFFRFRFDTYDVATAKKVAVNMGHLYLGLLGWWRAGRVLPVDSGGQYGLPAIANPKTGFSDVRYELKDGNILLLGLIGWGRVNHKRYMQILWIPIPLGDVRT